MQLVERKLRVLLVVLHTSTHAQHETATLCDLDPRSLMQLDLERKLRALLTKEKERAEEEAALAMGLCTGGAILP